MKKILYIISKKVDQDIDQLIPSSIPIEYSVSAILIQGGINQKPIWAFPFFAIEDDISTNQQYTLCSKIQYSDMLYMIFESDTVISL